MDHRAGTPSGLESFITHTDLPYREKGTGVRIETGEGSNTKGCKDTTYLEGEETETVLL